MLGKRLILLRNEIGLTQDELSSKLNISRGTYAHYEIGKRNPDYETLKRLADYFGVTIDYLLGRDELDITGVLETKKIKLVANGQPITQNQRLNIVRILDNPNAFQAKTVRLVGQIRMGLPIMAEEHYQGELEIPSDIEADFALETEGDSMIGVGLLEGDYAICREAQTAESGEIVVALRDYEVGYAEATLKYFFNNEGEPVLRAANPRFKDIPFTEGWRIAGKLIGIIRKNAPSYHLYTSYLAARDIKIEKWEPALERAFQLGIEPEEFLSMLNMIGRIAKK